MDLVAVEQSVGAVLGQRPPGNLRHRPVGFGHVLGHAGGEVDAEAVHTAVAPEAQGGQKVLAHGRVVPVEVGLLGGEDVEVPLAGAGRARAGQGRAIGGAVVDALPGGAAEHGAPIARRLGAAGAGAGAHMVEGAFGRVGAAGQRGAEPGVPVGGVVGDDVDHDADAGGMKGGDQTVEIGQGADARVHVAVVVDVVAAVGQGRGVEGREPDGVDAESRQVRHATGDPVQVADAVGVGVGEGPRVDLVDDGVLPPLAGEGSRSSGRRWGGLRVRGHGRILPGIGWNAERAGDGATLACRASRAPGRRGDGRAGADPAGPAEAPGTSRGPRGSQRPRSPTSSAVARGTGPGGSASIYDGLPHRRASPPYDVQLPVQHVQ